MGSVAVKRVKGRDYLYYIYYENGQKRNAYCGLASKQESKRKALDFEIAELRGQRKNLAERIRDLEMQKAK